MWYGFFFKSHHRILWIDVRGISNMLVVLRVDNYRYSSNASQTNLIISPDFFGHPFLLSSCTDPVLRNVVNMSQIALSVGPFL